MPTALPAKRDLVNPALLGRTFVMLTSMSAVDVPTSSLARRDQILKVSAELFARYGYHAVGMRTIAEAVGVRTSSLYHHFPGKHDILHAIGLAVTQAFIELHLPLLDGDDSRRDKLARLMHAHVTYFALRAPEVLVWRRELPELVADARYARIVDGQREYQAHIETLIAEGVAAGEFGADDPHLTAMAVLDLVNGVTNWYRPDGPLDIETLADRYVAMCLKLVAK